MNDSNVIIEELEILYVYSLYKVLSQPMKDVINPKQLQIMADINPTIEIFTLNVKGLNISIKDRDCKRG